MPRGNPEKVEAFENLDISKIFVGQRHSAAISSDGSLYTFGNGNWGTLGHGDENNIKF